MSVIMIVITKVLRRIGDFSFMIMERGRRTNGGPALFG
jgi:hypothetical protein